MKDQTTNNNEISINPEDNNKKTSKRITKKAVKFTPVRVIKEQAARKIKTISELSDLEKFCLDATIINIMPDVEKIPLAYIMSRNGKVKQDNPKSIYHSARRWYTSEKVQNYIKLKIRQVRDESESDTLNSGSQCFVNKVIETVSKDEMIKEFSALFRAEVDPKLKAEIGIKLADIAGMKKQEQQTDDTTIHYYLPLKCGKCALYLSAKKSQSNNKNTKD